MTEEKVERMIRENCKFYWAEQRKVQVCVCSTDSWKTIFCAKAKMDGSITPPVDLSIVFYESDVPESRHVFEECSIDAEVATAKGEGISELRQVFPEFLKAIKDRLMRQEEA